MMDYEDFKEMIVDRIKDFLPDSFADCKVRVEETYKVNKKQDSMSFLKPGLKQQVSPVIYIDEVYADYRRDGNFGRALTNAAIRVANAMEKNPEAVMDMVDYSKARENIIFNLINTEKNRELLENCPHKEVNDLSVIYKWVVDKNENSELCTITINNNMLKALEISPEEIYDIAYENTRRILPSKVESMKEVISQMMAKAGMPEDMLQEMMSEVPDDDMWVITNEHLTNGAGTVLYDDVLAELAEKAGADLYLLPSSINEMIAVTDKGKSVDELKELVGMVNQNEVPESERLSDNVYFYDKKLHTLTMATEAREMDLGKKAAENLTAIPSKGKAR